MRRKKFSFRVWCARSKSFRSNMLITHDVANALSGQTRKSTSTLSCRNTAMTSLKTTPLASIRFHTRLATIITMFTVLRTLIFPDRLKSDISGLDQPTPYSITNTCIRSTACTHSRRRKQAMTLSGRLGIRSSLDRRSITTSRSIAVLMLAVASSDRPLLLATVAQEVRCV